MSKLKVYAVHDSKILAFDRPFFQRSRGEALRTWEHVSNDASTPFSSHPEDFALMELGEFDTDTGRFENLDRPFNCGLAVQFKKQPSPGAPLLESIK